MIASALMLSVHFRPVTMWLFISIPCLIVAGFLLMCIFSSWEIGALIWLNAGFILAGLAFLLAVGSML